MRRGCLPAILKPLCALLAILFALFLFVAPTCFRGKIEKALSREFNAQCSVRDVSGPIWGPVRIKEISFAIPLRQLKPLPYVLMLENVTVEHRLAPLLCGRVSLEKLRIGKAHLRYVDVVPEWLASLSAAQPATPREEAFTVILEQGAVDVSLPDWLETFEVEDIQATVVKSENGAVRGRMAFHIHDQAFEATLDAPLPGAGATLALRAPQVDAAQLPRLNQHARTAPKAWRALALSGALNAEARIHLPERTWSATIEPAGATIQHPELPAPFTEVRGRISYAQNKLTVENLSGRILGARVRVRRATGRIENGTLMGLSAEGGLHGFDFARWRKAQLPDPLRTWRARANIAEGTADASFDATWTPGHPLQANAEIEVRRLRAKPSDFPAGIRDVNATLALRPDWDVAIRQAHGAFETGGRFTVRGDVRAGSGATFERNLEVSLYDVPLQAETVGRLPENLRGAVEFMGVESGLVSADARLSGQTAAADIRVRGATLRPRPFPYPLTNASGRIRWTSEGGEIALAELSARHGQGRISGSGRVRLGESATLDLTLSGSRLPIDHALRDLLPPAMQEAWTRWQPEGRFDVAADIRDMPLSERHTLADRLARTSVELNLRNASLNHPDRALGAKRIAGRIALADGRISFPELHAHVMGVPLAFSGWVMPAEAPPSFDVTAHALRIPLTPEVTGPWAEAFSVKLPTFHPDGELTLFAKVRRLPEDGGKVPARLSVELRNLETAIQGHAVFAEGTASVQVDDLTREDTPGAASLRLDRLDVDWMRGAELRADIRKQGDRISAHRCELAAYGGKLTLDPSYCDLSDLRWRASGQVSHVELEDLLNAAGTPEERISTGWLKGAFAVQGKGPDLSAIRGTAQAKVANGRIIELPLLLSVLRVLDLRWPENRPATQATADLAFLDGEMLIRDLLLLGGSVPIHVRGAIGLDGKLAWPEQPVGLVFSVAKQKGLIDRIPVVKWIKRWTVDRLRGYALQATVSGVVGNYEVSTPIDFLRSPARGLWRMVNETMPSKTAEYVRPWNDDQTAEE